MGRGGATHTRPPGPPALGPAPHQPVRAGAARAAGLILQAALRETGSADADELAEKIGMRLGRISPMGTVPCSIAKEARGAKASVHPSK